MPLYEYKCAVCQRHTEKIQKFSDPEITICPFCAGPLQRVISAPAFSLKGGGWYADGYGSPKPAGAAAGAAAGTTDGSAAAPPAAAPSDGASTPASTPSAPATPASAPASTPSAPASSSSTTKT